MTWELSLTGLFIGLLVGVTGMGGGSLMTPILILLFGFKPTLAVGTDILHGAVFKTFGAVQHRRLGTVHARMTFWMFLGSAPMSLAGVQTAEWLQRRYGDGVESTSAKVNGAALVWVAGFAHLVHGNVDLGAMAWLLLGSVPGILVGSRITVRLPERSLRVGLATVLLASGVRLLEAPGYDFWVPAILVVGAVVAARVEYRRLNGAPARTDPV